ncbi:glycoside hydrolase family 3 C-terminal domain-containing protein [Polaribacter sp. MSW13]|uniref:beta-N-acetylhexosaminidase n=1 Tax=Polaribacter marinus TaxID=2916838 RepID=A0A9X1VQD6_9FLAO|nr:glycoside hydrolase family 3 N-terminal domain-containing protein [Polaribacter marinus]MCI2228760.1 glycoside hydrolase family 3 C-terminal domain-containing protein [Polaribacter marinus]
MKKTIPLVIIVFSVLFSCNKKETSIQLSENSTQKKWVDSIYNQMTLKEKVGQLFMIAAYSNKDQKHTDSIQKLIKENGIGGLVFFQGGPVRQAKQTNLYQSVSKVPLLIAMDAEWGLNMRLDSTARFPYNMTLGAVKDNDLIRRVGEKIGEHCNRLGVHINFAPVVDINTNSKNPIIGVRSFAEDKYNVTNKALAFTKGLQSQNVLACAKHFPGHGDTDKDSHKTLPTVLLSKARIDSVEMYPYKQLFKNNMAGVMVAHLNVPSLEKEAGVPSSLSHHIVSDLLKEKLGFKGLVFTDALNMKGAANYKETGAIDLAAFMAGNDILVLTEDASKGISKIMEAYQKKELTEERLAHSVKKILTAKFDVQLHNFKPIKTQNLISDLNDETNNILNEEVFINAITAIKNENNTLPLKKDKNKKIAFLGLGDGSSSAFLKELKLHLNIDEVSNLPHKDLLNKLKKYDQVIIGYHRLNSRKTVKISNADKAIIEAIALNNNVILDVFASQYSLENLSFKNLNASIISYENSEIAQKISAQVLIGNKEANGKLPASMNQEFKAGHGIKILE